MLRRVCDQAKRRRVLQICQGDRGRCLAMHSRRAKPTHKSPPQRQCSPLFNGPVLACSASLIDSWSGTRLIGPVRDNGAFRTVVGAALGTWISFPRQNESTAPPDLSRIVTQVEVKGRAGGRNTGVSHVRSFAILLRRFCPSRRI